MTVERHAELTARVEDITTVPLGRQVESLRMVKDPEEIREAGGRLPAHRRGPG